jgi:hypothetical protein
MQGDEIGSAGFLEAQFGVGVDVATDAGERGVELRDLLDGRHEFLL